MASINLAPFATPNQGNRDMIAIFSKLATSLPGLIRDNQDYQVKKQKFSDNKTANDTALSQLRSMASELGIDANIIQVPQTDQDHEQYLSNGIATIWTAAQGAGKRPEDIINAATKLSGGGAIPQVQQAQAGVFQQQEEAQTLQKQTGALLQGTQLQGNVNPQILNAPGPSDPFTALIEQKEATTPSGEVTQENVRNVPEFLISPLMTIDRDLRRPIISDLLSELITPKEALDQVNAARKTVLEGQGIEAKAEADSRRKIKEDFAKQSVSKISEVEIFDTEGNPMGFVSVQDVLSGKATLGTGKKIKQPATEHISRQEGGAGGGRAASNNAKLLKTFKDDSQKALTRLGEIAKYIQNPTSAAGREIAKQQGFTSVADAQEERNRLNNLIGDNTFKIRQLEARLGLKQQPTPESGTGGQRKPLSSFQK